MAHHAMTSGEERLATKLDLRGTAFFLTVLVFFFISGACGLLYQVVWTRKLVLLFGSTSYAVSTVLSIFFLGLGVGSLWGGRLAETTNKPLYWYGIFEIVIGLWALFFIFLVDAGEGVVVAILRMFPFHHGGIALRALLATAFLIVPVTLMGATLPLLARYVTESRRVAGLRIGALYTLNTIGAVNGTVLTGFVFIAALGYTWTTCIGAAANAIVGLAAVGLHFLTGVQREGWQSGVSSEPEAKQEESAPPKPVLLLVIATFGVSGFCALALEVLWTRLLVIIFTGTTYAFTTMLAALLCGLVIGSTVASAVADRIKQPVRAFAVAEILAGLSCAFTLILFARAPDVYNQMAHSAGHSWEGLLQAKFMVSALVLLLPTVFFGATFPLAVKAVAGLRSRLGIDVGVLYGSNTLGGVLGAAAGGFLIIPLLGSHNGILFLGCTLYVMAVVLFWSARKSILERGSVLAVGAVVLTFIMAGQGEHVGRRLTEADMPESSTMIHFSEGVEGTVAVSDEADASNYSNRVLWINGVQATASIEKGVRMNRFQGALPLVYERTPRNALLMCFGSGVTCGTLALHDFERIDAVEISPEVLDATHYFAEDNENVAERDNVRFIVDDGRNFMLTTENSYDLITFEPMPLALAGVSTFYTQEYYELCLERLAEGGVVSQWVPLHSLNPEVVRSLVYTFTTVFPEYCAWFINADLFLIGSNRPLKIDYQNTVRNLSQPELKGALAEVGLAEPVELLSYFLMDKASLDSYAAGGRVMTDDRPWAEFEAPKLMNQRTVQDTLAELQPHYQSPVTLLDRNTVPPGDSDAVIAALNQRHAAKVVDLAGVIEYYGGSIGSQPEEQFLEALRIAPGDQNALFYLRQIATRRMELFIRWEEWQNAEEYIDKLLTAAPDEPLFNQLAGDLAEAKAAE